MRVWLALLMLLAISLSGCTDDPGPDDTDPGMGDTAPDPGTDDEPEPAPVYVRDTIATESFSVEVGNPDGSGCDVGPFGFLVASETGNSALEGRDYDIADVDESWLGMNFTFNNTGESATCIIWLNSDGIPVEGSANNDNVAVGGSHEGQVPAEATRVGVASRTQNAASADLEIWDTVLEA